MSFADLVTSACYSYLAHSHYVIPCVSALYSYRIMRVMVTYRWGMPTLCFGICSFGFEYLHVCSYMYMFVCIRIRWCCLFERRLFFHSDVSDLVALNWLHIHIVVRADLLSLNDERDIYFISFSHSYHTNTMFASFSHRLIIFRTELYIYIFRCHIHDTYRQCVVAICLSGKRIQQKWIFGM